MFAEPIRVLIAIIAAIVLLIGIVLCATVYRRVARSRIFRKLDRHRERYRMRIREFIDGGNASEDLSAFVFRPRSAEWHAVEQILSELVEDPQYEAGGIFLFDRLGYRSYYERKLRSRDIITKSSAADKLGRMRCKPSIGKLVPFLDGESAEIVSVTVRSLSKIGSREALEAVLERLPGLLARSLVAKKSIETSLRNFGPVMVPVLVRHGDRYTDPVSKSSILEVLSNLGSLEALPFAFGHMNHADAEVRAKALKLIGTAGDGLPEGDKEKILPLLDDPVWFVRLQAAKALGTLRYREAGPLLAKRLLDGNWQVRNAAATAVVLASDKAIDIFLDALGCTDRYVKESICEEIQKTDFVYRLIANLDSTDRETYGKSREILDIMESLGYGTPLREHLRTGAFNRTWKGLRDRLQAGSAS